MPATRTFHSPGERDTWFPSSPIGTDSSAMTVCGQASQFGQREYRSSFIIYTFFVISAYYKHSSGLECQEVRIVVVEINRPKRSLASLVLEGRYIVRVRTRSHETVAVYRRGLEEQG